MMKLNRYEVENKYALVIGLLSSLEEEVVSEEEYIATKDFDINTDEGFYVYFKYIIRPWFVVRDENKREKLIKLIDCLLEDDNYLTDMIFNNLFLICDIKDDSCFLQRLKKNLMEENLCVG